MSYVIYPKTKHVAKIKELSVLLGSKAYSPTTKYNVGGSDLGIPCYDDKRGKMYFWFGDTFREENLIGSDWRSNTVGISQCKDLSNGIVWDEFLCDDDGRAVEITNSEKTANDLCEEVTNIPTGAICIDGVHYMFYMSIARWLPGIGWIVNYNGVMKSADGKHFMRCKDLYFTCANKEVATRLLGISDDEYEAHLHPGFAQVFPILANDGYVYLFGLEAGRHGGVKLARVKPCDIEDMSRYEYFLKDGSYLCGAEGRVRSANEDCEIVPPDVGEISVCYSRYLGKYVMTYLSDKLRSRETPGIVMRVSDNLTEWSEAELVLSYYDYYKLYGGFMHERLASDGGKKMYMLLSQWTSPRKRDHGYNVKLMEITLKK